MKESEINFRVRTFLECPKCSGKSGSPNLCETCIHNRTLIDRLQAHVRELEEKNDPLVGKLRTKLRNRRREVKNLMRAYEASLTIRQLSVSRLFKKIDKLKRMELAIERAKQELEQNKMADALLTLSNAEIGG